MHFVKSSKLWKWATLHSVALEQCAAISLEKEYGHLVVQYLPTAICDYIHITQGELNPFEKYFKQY